MGSVSENKSPPPRLSAPQPLNKGHWLDEFSSGVAPLDDWLKRHAARNEADDGSRTFVICDDNRVVGYYSLAAGSISHGAATGKVRRNMPNPVPVILLGRLAIDQNWQGKGLGADLLRDAVLRAVSAGETIGVRAILVHAISEAAKGFYESQGFHVSPIEPISLMITLAEVRQMIRGGK